MQNLKEPSFLWTKTTGLAHGLTDSLLTCPVNDFEPYQIVGWYLMISVFKWYSTSTCHLNMSSGARVHCFVLKYTLIIMFSCHVLKFTFIYTWVWCQHGRYNIGCCYTGDLSPFLEGDLFPCSILEPNSNSFSPCLKVS